MTKWILILVGGAALVASAPLSRAVDEQAAKRAVCDDLKKLSPEAESKVKEPRKTNSGPARTDWEKRLEKMTPEEREAKRKELKERLEKRIADLRSKQTNATITPQETRELERREQILKRFEQAPPGGVKTDGTEPKAPAAPASQ
jgi:hypothetical protein